MTELCTGSWYSEVAGTPNRPVVRILDFQMHFQAKFSSGSYKKSMHKCLCLLLFRQFSSLQVDPLLEPQEMVVVYQQKDKPMKSLRSQVMGAGYKSEHNEAFPDM